jgi:hypothetical protein
VEEEVILMQSYSNFMGVDFSGGKNAGDKIWVSRGKIENGVLHVYSCDRMSDLHGSENREIALTHLREMISSLEDGVAGLDFPFSIPRELIGHSRWDLFAKQFGESYPDEHDFRRRCFTKAKNKELKRLTDSEMKTPFCPYNLRLYRQTYFGIRDVLAPLVTEDRVCVAPMQCIVPGKPLVVEICPASTLKLLNLYRQYKGKAPEHRRERAAILDGLESRRLVTIDAKVRPKLLKDTEGDALDSVVAALAAFRALGQIERKLDSARAEYLVEGFVYA